MNTEKISQNLNRILTIAKGYNPTIIAVSKYYPKEMIENAYHAGLRNFGENRVLEAIEKINDLEDEVRKNSNYHLIGHLQSKKAKSAVGNFDLIHSIDSVKLAGELDKEAKHQNVIQEILIQVNNANEAQKSGVVPLELNNLLNEISEFSNVKVVGLMNIAPLTDDTGYLNKLFKEMFELKEEFHLKELSMGMSNDFKIALDNGATMIRVGRTLFE